MVVWNLHLFQLLLDQRQLDQKMMFLFVGALLLFPHPKKKKMMKKKCCHFCLGDFQSKAQWGWKRKKV